MIEFIVLIILILFAIILYQTFVSIPFLLFNLIILITLYFLITRDLKRTDNHKHYIISLFLAALFLIFSYTGSINYLVVLSKKIFLSIVSLAAILVYAFGNLVRVAFEFYRKIKHKK